MEIGIDLVEHQDFIAKDQRFIEYVLSEEERQYFEKVSHPQRKIEYLASRFACKEAIVKCLKRKIEVSILNDKNGVPYIQSDLNLDLRLSLSHTDHYSVAVVISLP